MSGVKSRLVASGAVLGAVLALVSCTGGSDDGSGSGSAPGPLSTGSQDQDGVRTDAGSTPDDSDEGASTSSSSEFVTVDPGSYDTTLPRSTRDAILQAGHLCNEVSARFLASYGKAVSGMDNSHVGKDGRKGVMQVSDEFVERNSSGPEFNKGAEDPASAIWAVANVGCAQAQYINEHMDEFDQDNLAPSLPATIWAAETPDAAVEVTGMESAQKVLTGWDSAFMKNGIQFK